jgi:hypothetical protein
MSARNCHHSLRKNPVERSSRLLRGESLKSSAEDVPEWKDTSPFVFLKTHVNLFALS